METQHKFEIAGLGLAPFRCVGMLEKVYVSCPGATPQPSGTCDYCGNGIKYCFQIVSKDGRKFIVGSDCVAKHDDSGMKKVVAKKILEVKTKAKKAAEAARIAIAKETIKREAVAEALKALPHPNLYFAKQGKTKLEYCEFLFTDQVPHNGQFESAKIVERIAIEIAK